MPARRRGRVSVGSAAHTQGGDVARRDPRRARRRSTAAAVFELVRDQLAEILEIDPAKMTEDASFADDLDADSLALIELVEALEEELGERRVGFRIDDEDLEDLKTVRDAVDYVEVRLKAELTGAVVPARGARARWPRDRRPRRGRRRRCCAAVTHSSYAAEHRDRVERAPRVPGRRRRGAGHRRARVPRARPRRGRPRPGPPGDGVAEPSLAAAARSLGIDEALLPRHAARRRPAAASKDSVLADAFEAVIARGLPRRGLEPPPATSSPLARTSGSEPRRRDAGASDLKSRAPGVGRPATGSAPPRLRRPRRGPRPRAAVLRRGADRRPVAASGEGPSKKAAELAAAARPAVLEGSAMPELPEVETVRAALSRDITGKKIKTVTVHERQADQAAQVGEGVPWPARGPHHQVGWSTRQEPCDRPGLGQPPRRSTSA